MNLNASPFHARAVEANRLNTWENRGGFTLAADYGSVEEEAIAARFGAVVADVSWHPRVELSGEQAPAFVARLCTRNAAALGLGAALEVLWLNDAGAVRGQGTVIRIAANRFLLASAAADGEWIENAARLYGVAVTDRTRSEGVLALIGPASGKILKAAGLDGDLPLLCFRTAVWRGLDVSLSRLGLGFEIGCSSEDALIVWDRLAAAGRSYALLPAGQAALDILETESGVLSPLRDYTPAREGFATVPTPQSLGLSALVDRAHLFNGRAGFLAAGPDTRLAGILLDGDSPRPGTPLRRGSEPVGRTLGGRFSPALRQAIAFASVPETLPDGLLTAGGSAARLIGLPFLPIPAATETAGHSV
jgi:glycine cleavage system aminomethyltransferase T